MSCALTYGEILDGFCARDLPVTTYNTRSVIWEEDAERLFVLDSDKSGTTDKIWHLYDSDDDGIPDQKKRVAGGLGLTHGLAIYDGYMYASNRNDIFRWALYDDEGEFLDFPLEADEELVIENLEINSSGESVSGHWTRTIVFDERNDGTMYVSVGSDENTDEDSFRSRIRTLPGMKDITSDDFPINFLEMTVLADGVRNECGLAFDKHGMLWGVENGADNLDRDDMGGAILTQDNPAEELNRFDPDGGEKHYGYPYCWTEFDVPAPYGLDRGTVWTWPDFMDSVTDEECRSDAYQPPLMAMQAHSAPLGITFYNYSTERPSWCDGVEPFPEEMDGYAFIAFHGSWNRKVPTGYKVVYVEMDENGEPSGDQPVDLLWHGGSSPQWPGAQWPDGFRPVDVEFDPCGRLMVTSDGKWPKREPGSKVVLIDYRTESQEPTDSPSASQEPTDSPSATPTRQPTSEPTKQPTKLPTKQLTSQPTKKPTSQSTNEPTKQLTSQPTKLPTKQLTSQPTSQSTNEPTKQLTSQPTKLPTSQSTNEPTSQPTKFTNQLTSQPTKKPTNQSTNEPTRQPTEFTSQPTKKPTSQPTKFTFFPSSQPTKKPTSQSTNEPTSQPTKRPTKQPVIPTKRPTRMPTPTPRPTTFRPTTVRPTTVRPTASTTRRPS